MHATNSVLHVNHPVSKIVLRIGGLFAAIVLALAIMTSCPLQKAMAVPMDVDFLYVKFDYFRAGQTPADVAMETGCGAYGAIKSYKLQWYEDSSSTPMADTDVFTAGHTYKLDAAFVLNPGYVPVNDMKVTFIVDTAGSKQAAVVTELGDGSHSVASSFVYDTLQNTHIYEINMDGFHIPVAGEDIPATMKVTSHDDLEGVVKVDKLVWYEIVNGESKPITMPAKFELGKVYRAELTIESINGYDFDEYVDKSIYAHVWGDNLREEVPYKVVVGHPQMIVYSSDMTCISPELGSTGATSGSELTANADASSKSPQTGVQYSSILMLGVFSLMCVTCLGIRLLLRRRMNS